MARRTPPRNRIYNKPFFYFYDKWNEYKKQIEERSREEESRIRREEDRRRIELELENKMWEETRKRIYDLLTAEEKEERRQMIEGILRKKEKRDREFLFRNVSPSLRAKYAGKRKTKRKGKSRATF